MKSHNARRKPQQLWRRAPYGARGLKSPHWPRADRTGCRAPYGARGLKYQSGHAIRGFCASRPVWGAWIEIDKIRLMLTSRPGSRPVWGAWIEIRAGKPYYPQGVVSRPVWGAWIEIIAAPRPILNQKSRPVWGAWIEIAACFLPCRPCPASRPVWGAWIEMAILLLPGLCGMRRAPYGARGLK